MILFIERQMADCGRGPFLGKATHLERGRVLQRLYILSGLTLIGKWLDSVFEATREAFA